MLSHLSHFWGPLRAAYYDPDGPLFGQSVADTFPSASKDVEEAGKCFALGRWTASVFHCMRVLELGLRSLAKRLRVPKAERDTDNWGALLGKIEGKIKKSQTDRRGSKMRQQSPLYSQAATNFGHFNTAWRRHVSHARDNYDEEQARRILDHVESFMNSLCDLGLTES